MPDAANVSQPSVNDQLRALARAARQYDQQGGFLADGFTPAGWDLGACSKALKATGHSDFAEFFREENGHYPRDLRGWPVEMIDGVLVSLETGERREIREVR